MNADLDSPLGNGPDRPAVDADCLKLTSYFGERQRCERRFLGDALLDLYGQRQIATSIMLRGAEGFGLKHHLRSDTSLTLSEDLPAVAIAVDTRERIEALLDNTAQLGPGLITLERARLLSGDIASAALSDDPAADQPAAAEAPAYSATKLTVYLGRQERVDRMPAHVAVCDLLHRRGIAGASVVLGVDGTARGVRARARFFGRNADVPMMVIAVGSGAQLAQVLPELGALLAEPLLTIERVRVCKRDGQLLEAPHALPSQDEHGLPLWQKLMIYTSEAALHDGQPIHRAITRRLRAAGAAGSTTLRGVWGFHGEHAPHGDRAVQLGRHVPTVTVVIDAPDRIAESFAIIDELTSERGLVTSEIVPALRAVAR